MTEATRSLSPALKHDPRWELVQRVGHSVYFQRTRRLREMLEFVCARVLEDGETEVGEIEIAVQVFEKRDDFDPGTDTLVRVQASQLRKRLAQYFTHEGAAEPLLIELPKGSYTPVFRERAAGPTAAVEEDEPLPRQPARRTLLIAGLAAALVLALLACAWLARDNRALRGRLNADGRRPNVERLWRQMFENGQPVQIVPPDATFTFFQDILRRQLAPGEYQNGQFLALSEKIEEVGFRVMAQRVMNRQFTSLADSRVLMRISRLAMSTEISVEMLAPRRASSQHFTGAHNAILLGSRRANPWVDPFEKKLNFQSRFDEVDRRCTLVNQAPRAGEEASYTGGGPQGHVYCRVAYLPNLNGSGSVLILSGTDLSSTDAGGEFITSEAWVSRLFQGLGVRPGARVPHFEVLLRANRIFDSATDLELVTYRVIG